MQTVCKSIVTPRASVSFPGFLILHRNASSKYSKTLNLPRTTFPLSMKEGLVVKRETEIQKKNAFADLYSWQRNGERKNEFILHDGPPYANGKPHVGHALNKILKDITNRYKLLQGFQVHYVPGWDCHGTPIEQKALAEIKEDYSSMDAMEIRSKARKFAEKTIKSQMSAFKRWGVMADWNTCYRTLDKQYEAAQLEVFYKMYEKKLIYEDYMPVFWSPSSKSALAEAELEYNDEHKSKAIYVKFPLKNIPPLLQNQIGKKSQAFALIWTTTPWTIPANKAICYGAKLKYVFVQRESNKDIYLLSTEVVNPLSQLLEDKFTTLATFEGGTLQGCTYVHPLQTNSELPLVDANHVTSGKGTGLVHTAPAHGPEDFQVAVRHGISLECMVDESGKYTEEAGPALVGKEVLFDGNDKVLDLIKDSLVHKEVFVHSYPYDWRTKKPVFYRASKQWFVDTRNIKENALKNLEDVTFFPKTSENGMVAQLQSRTYWCISRQRVWGVPIPVFHEENSGKVLLNRHSIDHMKKMVEEHGTDCWWTKSVEELLPQSVVEKSGFEPGTQFRKGTDVMDIWFDSGSSWAAVLGDKVADVYLEGYDQFGGWFQSSLLTSAAVNDRPPYKKIAVHGFVMDENGKKMSKSLGNVVDPQVIVSGGKNKKEEKAYGADILRWWSSQVSFDHKCHIGPKILDTCVEQIFRVRKMIRYLMGTLNDFDPKTDSVPYSELLPQDKYLLHMLHSFNEQSTQSYESFQYARVPQQVEKFITMVVSGFHSHIAKDRLYCSVKDSPERRSCQTAQYLVLSSLVQTVAPIIPHFAEEVFQYHPFTSQELDSIFKTDWIQPKQEWCNPEIEDIHKLIMKMRETFHSVIGREDPIEFDLVIAAQWRIFEQVKVFQAENSSSTSPLNEIFQCSTTSVLSRPPLVIPDESQPVDGTYDVILPDGSTTKQKYLMVVLPAESFLCDRCRRYTADYKDTLCSRCETVLKSSDFDSQDSLQQAT